MKRFSYLVLGAAGLVLTSCSNEDVVSNIGNGDGTANVTLTLTTPEIKTRVISDGTTANKLYWALYEVTDNSGVQALNKVTVAGDTENQYGNEDGEDFSMQTIKKLKLVDGKTYGFVFWAANEDAPYTVTFTQDGANMVANYSNVKANDETLDAFYAYVTLPVNGDVQLNVPMNRPFAQINIGTNDLKESKALGYTPATSTIKVQSYTTLDLVSGKVETSTPATWTFTHNDIPAETEIFPAGAEYNYLATTYILMSEDQKTVNVQFDYASGDELTTQDNHVRTVGSVPVKRNHRTNIYGQVLTGNAELLVYIEPEFMEPDLEPSPLQLVAALGGTVKLEEDFDFNEEKINRIYFKKDAIVDLNGKTVTGKRGYDGVFYVQDGAHLTIQGEGKVISQDEDHSTVVWVAGNSSATIEGGYYEGLGTDDQLIYCQLGTIYVKGGKFKLPDYQYTLNCEDNAAKSGEAKFVVTGGTFWKYDPSNIISEGASGPKSWVPEGYKSVKSLDENGEEWYTVVPNDVDAVVGSVDNLIKALEEGSETIMLTAGEYDFTPLFEPKNQHFNYFSSASEIVGYGAVIKNSPSVKFLNNYKTEIIGATVKGLTFDNTTAPSVKTWDACGNFYDCSFLGGYKSESHEFVTYYENCTFKCDPARDRAYHDGDIKTDVVMKNCNIDGFCDLGLNGGSITFDNCTLSMKGNWGLYGNGKVIFKNCKILEGGKEVFVDHANGNVVVEGL